MGPGHREHAVLSAAHVSDAVSDRPAGPVLLRRDDDDDVGGGDDLPVRTACTTRRPAFTFFYDSYIPIAVFLGMHLLFTDPSTSPRTELGRMIFGALYGLSTIALHVAAGQHWACRLSTTSFCRFLS